MDEKSCYICSACQRKQSKIGIQSGELITIKDIESIGWVKETNGYLCPFCSNNEDKLEKLFSNEKYAEELTEKISKFLATEHGEIWSYEKDYITEIIQDTINKASQKEIEE